jgi:hypothetical protein
VRRASAAARHRISYRRLLSWARGDRDRRLRESREIEGQGRVGVRARGMDWTGERGGEH